MQRPTSLERFGVYRYLRLIYDSYIRERLPQKIGVYNGVPVRDRALFDVTDEQPEYEEPLVDGIEQTIQPGDTVIVVGGGRGVSAVLAARSTGVSGDVSVYEGSKEQYNLVCETVELNCLTNRIAVEFAVVSEAVSLWGKGPQASVLDPADLPQCDVLVLDCEGAELNIVTDLTTYPRHIVVETHGNLGVPPDEMEQELKAHGYTITDREVEVPERDIVIFTASQ